MGVTILLKVSMEQFVRKLRQEFPAFTFVQGEVACWSAGKQQIAYSSDRSDASLWTLLHELGHALLGHHSYESDMDLLHKEVAAWQTARQLGRKYSLSIDEDYMQNCLDSYRDWLHKRSTCPHCGSHGLQPSRSLYHCLNCQGIWKVNLDRFCRPYRLKKPSKLK